MFAHGIALIGRSSSSNFASSKLNSQFPHPCQNKANKCQENSMRRRWFFPLECVYEWKHVVGKRNEGTRVEASTSTSTRREVAPMWRPLPSPEMQAAISPEIYNSSQSSPAPFGLCEGVHKGKNNEALYQIISQIYSTQVNILYNDSSGMFLFKCFWNFHGCTLYLMKSLKGKYRSEIITFVNYLNLLLINHSIN